MDRPNYRLIFGTIMVLLLFFTIIYEDSLITADPYSLDRGLEYVINDYVLKVEHPVKPNPLDKLGTDPLGRNVLSLLIKGSRVTLGIAFISTLIRLIIGTLISFITKDRTKRGKPAIYYILSLILNIAIGYLILSQSFFKELNLNTAILVSGLILGIFGWERIMISLKAKDDKAYGDVASWLRDKVPHIVINFFREMAVTLIILAVLGFLGITIGVNKYASIDTKFGIMPNYNPEWGGMLATAKKAIEFKAYWLVVGPGLFFIFGISAFLLISSGLLNNIKVHGSVVSKGMSKIGNFLSPKQYVEDVKRFSWNRSRVIAKTFIAIIIIMWITPSINAVDGYYQINKERFKKDLETIHEIQEKYGINTLEAKDKIGDYIIEELEKIYRLNPLFEDEFVQHIDYEIEDPASGEKELVQARNIAAFIWGKISNNPLVIVTDYGGELYRNGTSVAATLELARSLSEKNNQNLASRTMVFLFVDGSLEDGLGVYNALGNKHIDTNSFYIYLNYLALGDDNKIFMDTSSVFSTYRRHYRNIRNIKERARELRIPIEQDYFGDMFIDIETFIENKVSGLALSGIGKEEYDKYLKSNGENQDYSNKINIDSLEEQIQFLMNVAEKYAWSDKFWLGDKY